MAFNVSSRIGNDAGALGDRALPALSWKSFSPNESQSLPRCFGPKGFAEIRFLDSCFPSVGESAAWLPDSLFPGRV